MTVLHREMTKVVSDAATPLSKTPAEFRQLIADEIEKWKQVAKEARILVK
jgi:tripartite-type tricarboxylate transporter receptor subunit TctC